MKLNVGHCIFPGLLAVSLGLGFTAPVSAKAPNIVFILADDLDSATAAKMDQVKALITKQGTSFRHHYVNVSLCCPSRVSTLRGQFAHNTTIVTNGPPEGGFEGTHAKGLESSTIATWLQDAGYRTVMFGKYLNGYPDTAPSATYIPPGWNEWYVANDGAPYSGFNYKLNENGLTVSYGNAEADYLTDVLSNKVTDFIRRTVRQHPNRPFFAYVAPFAPHLPATPAPRHADAFAGIRAPRTASFNEADVSDKPAWVRDTPSLTAEQIADIDLKYRQRRQSLLAVDQMVQSIVDTLQATGQLSQTYVFFTSDNGFHLGQHRLESGKNTAFEEDIRVPLSVRGPGVPVGNTIDAFSANVDYAPTFAELAGIGTPWWVDGRSLVPFLRGMTPPSWRQAMLLAREADGAQATRQHSGLREPPDPFDTVIGLREAGLPGFHGLRLADGRTYIEYDTGERELYDNNNDAAQMRNIYGLITTHTTAGLASWLGALRHASGASLRQAELAAP